MPEPPPPSGRTRVTTALWWAAVGVIGVVGAVAPWALPDPDSTVPAALPVALIGSAVAGALVGVAVLDRGLVARRPTDEDDAARELLTRLVLQVALLEAPTLLAVAIAVVLGPPWLVLVAALPALAGLLAIRPGPGRRARLRRAWEQADPDDTPLEHP